MMARVVAFIRGINVGGKVMVSMAALKEMAEGLGFERVRTVLNSGNMEVEAGRRSAAGIEKLLEGEIGKRFDLEVEVMVRGTEELKEVIGQNPFARAAQEDPSHLVVMFFKSAPSAAAVRKLVESVKGRELLSAHGREVYIHYPDGIGTSKLTNALIEKTLGVRGTARNWNTLQKLAAIANGREK